MLNLGVVFFTNEKTWDLTNLSVPYYLKNTPGFKYDVHIVSNRFPDSINTIPNVNYFNCNEEYLGTGGHFGPCLRKFLKHTEYDYILFFCDDYLVKSPIKVEIFDEILSDVVRHNISKVHLGTLKHLENTISKWSQQVGPHYTLVEIDRNYRHVLSVQPCIWKVSDLLEILNNNTFLTLHELDNSNIKDKNGKYRNLQDNQEFYSDGEFAHYDHNYFGIYSGTTSYHVDERPMNSDYLVLDYIEFIRHGKILDMNMNSRKHIIEILQKNNLTEQFKHYF